MKQRREMIIATETTGINPQHGDRVAEICVVELLNHKPTGRVYHQYINPKHRIPQYITAVHGLNSAILRRYPTFAQIAPEFLEFIGQDSVLVAHNAEFDLRFLNAELQRAKYPDLSRHQVVDTLQLARRQFPQQRNSLDCLCRRFSLYNSEREQRGALSDARLLTQIYLHLKPGMGQKIRQVCYSIWRYCGDFLRPNKEVQRIFY